MRVGLNLLFVDPGGTGGMETYARELVSRLPAAMPEATFLAFAGRELTREWEREPWHPAIGLRPIPVSSSSRVRRTLAEQALVPVGERRSRLDLVHHLTQTAPVFNRCPSVITVHDLIYLEHPGTHAGLLSRGVAAIVPAAARRADRLIAPSQATARSIELRLAVPSERIDVVPEGPGREAAAVVDEGAGAALRRRLGLGGGPIVLSVSARRPHKNLGRLIAAMAAVPEATLVLPGYPGPFDGEIEAAAAGAGVSDRVRLCGWLPDDELEILYAIATCLAFPSLAEGFGLPVLEAMARGLPVATSNLSAMPEVAGDAALFFDPMSEESIASSLQSLLNDSRLREQLREKGLARARQFSWEATARGTVESYRRALGS